MLLKSSSTPVIGSLISPSFSDSPNKDLEDTIKLNSTTFSCRSSPTSQETTSSSLKGLRRASSDGNFKGLPHSHSSFDMEDQFLYLCAQKKSSVLNNETSKTMLKTAPSFEIYHSVDGIENEQVPLNRTVTIGEGIDALGIDGGNFSFGSKLNMGLIEEEGECEEEGLNGMENLRIGVEIERPVSPPMYLATGLGIIVPDFDNCGEVIDLTMPNFEDSADAEEYYERMIDEYPCHPLILRNYAHLLQKKGDLYGAEDYYHRATMVDPGDGESWMQYAKLVWELHHDQHRALTYFERATLASPQDSNVLAAYASFLWEMEDDDTAQGEHIQVIQIDKRDLNKLDDSVPDKEIEPVSPSLRIAAGLRIDVTNFTAADDISSGDLEEYLKRMVEENPCNSLVLGNYAQFLHQTKGDLEGAEEYYSRAILADPGVGEIMSQYAKLVWELHHDCATALCYFERAVQASPADSHVLAAYARFLWEIDEDEVGGNSDHFQQMSPIRQGTVTTANA